MTKRNDTDPSRGMSISDVFSEVERHDPALSERVAQRAPYRCLGMQIAKARIAAGMSQRELAKAAGLRQPQIAQIEVGMTNPTWRTIHRLAVALEPHKIDLDEALSA